MDLPLPILTDPQRPLRPRESRVTAAAGRRDRGQHPTRPGIDLLDAIAVELEEMLAVEGRPRAGAGDVERALHLATARIEGDQAVAGGKPHLPTVIADAMHLRGSGEGTVLTNDLGH